MVFNHFGIKSSCLLILPVWFCCIHFTNFVSLLPFCSLVMITNETSNVYLSSYKHGIFLWSLFGKVIQDVCTTGWQQCSVVQQLCTSIQSTVYELCIYQSPKCIAQHMAKSWLSFQVLSNTSSKLDLMTSWVKSYCCYPLTSGKYCISTAAFALECSITECQGVTVFQLLQLGDG